MIVTREAEIVQNYAYFQQVVGSMMSAHAGQFALLHQKHVVEFFDTAGEAVLDGARRYGIEPFSVQRVINKPIDLGFLSHASDNGLTVSG